MIISLDPSGNHHEGNGTTGIAIAELFDKPISVGEIKANDYDTPEAYWNAHLALFKEYEFHSAHGEMEMVMEGYRLYGHKADTQTNSILETPMLIGVIRHWCFVNEVPLKIQYAVEVKNRWSDEVLQRKGIIRRVNGQRILAASGQRLNNHKTDAVRHLMHYIRYGRR